MTTPEVDPTSPARRWRRHLAWLGGLLLVYLVLAYVLMPVGWRIHERKHRAMDSVDRVTHTANGIPGDPINLALVGTETNLVQGMIAAGWYPADPITLESSLRIAVDSVFRRPDDQAPVSNLYLFGRKQDLAFEQPVGNDPRQRHHVRFWRWDQLEAGEPVWFGSATYDERVGLSHTTGQITHHIGPDVDAERDRIVQELEKLGRVSKLEWKADFHSVREGRNGGGDLWRTDGRLAIVYLQGRP
jgi:hypothetical protein